jgi:serine/threonine protein kinase
MFVDHHDSKMLKVGRASDVWSLGCILYQMLAGAPPFAHINPIVRKLQCIVNPQYPINYDSIKDPLAVTCIQGCLTREPKKRWTIPQLLSHEFLKNDSSKLPLTENLLFDLLKRGILKFTGHNELGSLDIAKIKEIAQVGIVLIPLKAANP